MARAQVCVAVNAMLRCLWTRFINYFVVNKLCLELQRRSPRSLRPN
jgi:hypothetical protein